MRYLAFFTLFLLAACNPARPATLSVELGETNRSDGLTVPSGGDGQNVPDTIAGSACRRVAGGQSAYLYVVADDKRMPPGRYDAYLTVEYYDGAPGIVGVNYDKGGVGAELKSHYAGAEDAIVMLGTGKWQRAVLHLPDATFAGGENFSADLRLCSDSLAVRRIEVSTTRPADYRQGGIDPKALDQFRTRIGPGMELTFGNDAGAAQAALYRALGVTSVESYVAWQTVEDAGRDRWDWSRWDHQTDVLQRAGLKWVPFLVAGPAYATPKWARESAESVPYVCLEHEQASKVQSIFNPALRGWVDHFLKGFADRYRDKGVIESLLLGVSGIYGESIYPAGPEGGWTAEITGTYHNHMGWWAGDRYAAESFRAYVHKHYADVAALNRAWKSAYASFADVKPFLPDKAPSPRARADFVDWYVSSMTDWATYWVATARKYFPSTEIYLCTGGDGSPVLGADFSAQAKAIAPYKAGIRITNEGSNYAANFAITREVATACRAYGTYFGYEPASGVDPNGVIARIYNATASGARQLHYYSNNVTGKGEAVANFRRYASFLQRRSPRIHAGVYLPKVSWAIDPGSIGRLHEAAREIRDCMDIEFVDRNTLGAAALKEMRVLALPDAPYAEAGETAKLRQWVADGGILVALESPDRPLLRTPDGSDAGREALFAHPPQGLNLARVTLSGPAPRRFRVEIGKPGDDRYLSGDWFGPESGGEFPGVAGATKRWTGARPVLYLPIVPGADATLTLDVHLNGHSLPGANRVLVNGTPVGALDKAGTQTYRFNVPAAILAGRQVAEVTLEMRTWKPSDYGEGDGRALGAAVRAVEICARGAEAEAPGTSDMRVELAWDAILKQCSKRIGKGATVVLPAGSRGAATLAEAMAGIVAQPGRLVPGARGIALPSPEHDRVFASEFADGVLYYNAADQAQKEGGVTVPAHGIAWEKRAK